MAKILMVVSALLISMFALAEQIPAREILILETKLINLESGVYEINDTLVAKSDLGDDILRAYKLIEIPNLDEYEFTKQVNSIAKRLAQQQPKNYVPLSADVHEAKTMIRIIATEIRPSQHLEQGLTVKKIGGKGRGGE